MKIKISGMMDYIQDESVPVGGDVGISAERVRERTMASLSAAPKGRGKSLRAGRILLIAAAVAAVLSVSVAASRGFGLKEMQGTVPDSGATVTVPGLSGTPEYQAALEWQGYLDEWYKTGENENDPYNTHWDVYDYEAAHSQLARDTLDSIVEKYGLRMKTKVHTSVESLEELYSELGADGFLPEMPKSREYDAGGREFDAEGGVFDGGGFAFFCAADLPGGYVKYSLYCYAKGIFDYGWHEYDYGYEDWNYTTDEGIEVMLALGSAQSVIAADLENCFVRVNVDSGTHNIMQAHCSYGEPTLDRADLEAIADIFDLAAIDALVAQRR